jgi:hypothetical protein
LKDKEKLRILYVKMDSLITKNNLKGLNDLVSDVYKRGSKKESEIVLSYTGIYQRELKDWDNLFNKINKKR